MMSRWLWELGGALPGVGRVPRKLPEASSAQVQRKGLQSRDWQGGHGGHSGLDGPQREEVVKQSAGAGRMGWVAGGIRVEMGRSSDTGPICHAKNLL